MSENKRIEDYESLRREMEGIGYKEKVCTISILKANLMAFLTAIPIVAACFILYFLKWGGFTFYISLPGMFLFLLTLIVYIVAHEVIHGLTWSFFCRYRWRSIHSFYKIVVCRGYI